MKKRKFALIFIIVCCILFAIRYTQVNRSPAYKVKNSYYSQGDTVQMGKNILIDGNMNGYQITVVKHKIWDWEEYLEFYEIDFQNNKQAYHPERVCDVIVKIKNNNKTPLENNGIRLMQLYLQKDAFLTSINQDLLFEVNPFLNKATDIALKPETEKEFHLPFSLYKDNLRKHIWDHPDTNPFYLVVTLYPEKQSILLK